MSATPAFCRKNAAGLPSIPSARQPSHEIGHTAVDLLLRENAEGEFFTHEQFVFQPELVVRESTSGPR